MEIFAWLTLAAFILFGLGWIGVYLDVRGQRRAITALEHAVGQKPGPDGSGAFGLFARIAAQDRVLQLVERAMTVERQGTIPARAPSPPSVTSGPKSDPRASAPVLAGPRMRAEILPGRYPSERIVSFATSDGTAHLIYVDARDVDPRLGESTVRVEPQAFEDDRILVGFPMLARAESLLWVPRALVLDAGAPRPLAETVPDSRPAPGRPSIQPGDLRAAPPPLPLAAPTEVERLERSLADLRQRVAENVYDRGRAALVTRVEEELRQARERAQASRPPGPVDEETDRALLPAPREVGRALGAEGPLLGIGVVLEDSADDDRPSDVTQLMVRPTTLGLAPPAPPLAATPAATPVATPVPPVTAAAFGGLKRLREGIPADEQRTLEERPGSPVAAGFHGAVRAADAQAAATPRPRSKRHVTLASEGVVRQDPRVDPTDDTSQPRRAR
jgi:hypothetical protein